MQIMFVFLATCSVILSELALAAPAPPTKWQTDGWNDYWSVDGITDYIACRVNHTDDTNDGYGLTDALVDEPGTESEAHCREACENAAFTCLGIEYKNATTQRKCELWKETPRWAKQVSSAPHVCRARRIHHFRKDSSGFADLGAGVETACRLSLEDEETNAYNTEYEGRTMLKPVTLEQCRTSCEALLNCKGIEYKTSDSKCELWNTRPLYAKPAADHQCFSFDRVLTDMNGWSNLVDQPGQGHACRVNFDDTSQNGTFGGFRYSYDAVNVTSLQQCQESCATDKSCKAIEWKDRASGAGAGKKCEIWTRTPQWTKPTADHVCMAYQKPRFDVNGFWQYGPGRGYACRLDSSDATSNGNGKGIEAVNATSLEACKAACIRNPSCQAIEFKNRTAPLADGTSPIKAGVKCEVWVEEPKWMQPVGEHVCMRFRRDATDSFGFKSQRNGSAHACRLGDFDDNSTDGQGTAKSIASADTLEDCQEACLRDASCKAIDWEDRPLTQPEGGKKCEVWTQMPGYTDWVGDHLCMTYAASEEHVPHEAHVSGVRDRHAFPSAVLLIVSAAASWCS
mmetsp:Transcript_37978/g.98294  ORF Transcript_37978/g.98294 Transcript_37978/m.98294 type:complete len:568 (+) Transcript_37978:117-1820(+)